MQKNGNQEMKSKPNQVSWEDITWDTDGESWWLIYKGEHYSTDGVVKLIRSLLKEERKELENKIVMLKSDIAHAIGYCQGLGHPETYLEKQYPDLVGEKLSKGKV